MKPYHERAALVFGAAGLSPAERLVLLALSHHLGGSSSSAWPSRRRLGEMCGLSRATVSRALASLAERGIVSSVQRCGSTSLRSIQWGGLMVRQGGLTVRQEGAHSETQNIEKKHPIKDTSDKLSDLWAELEAIRGGKRVTALGKRRAALGARLREHDRAAVLDVWRWVYTSDHRRAVFLRDQGYGAATILRPSKFSEYLRLASSPADRGPVLWAAVVEGMKDARSINPPGVGWALLPGDEAGEALACSALVSCLGASSLGMAWGQLRRLNGGQLKQAERRFVAAVRGVV